VAEESPSARGRITIDLLEGRGLAIEFEGEVRGKDANRFGAKVQQAYAKRLNVQRRAIRAAEAAEQNATEKRESKLTDLLEREGVQT
jgi:hypothetical protein